MAVSLSSALLQFLRELSRNNNREWFGANKQRYEEGRSEVIDFVDGLIETLAESDPEILKVDAKKSLFRIYRDTRFSEDKTPYKTNFGAKLSSGKNSPMYYLHIEPGKSFLAGGLFRPDAATLKKVRAAVEGQPQKFLDLVTDDDFRNHFRGLSTEQKLVRVPTGFSNDSPVAEYLKLKNFIVRYPLSDEAVLSGDATAQFAEVYRLMQPLNNFLKNSI